MWTKSEKRGLFDQSTNNQHHFRFSNMDKIKKIYPRFFHKTCKIGRPVWYKRHYALNFDLIKELDENWQQNFIMHHIREQDKLLNYRLPACSESRGEHVGHSIIVMDLEGVRLFQLPRVYGLLETICNIDANYYPETLAKIIVINAPMLFAGFWQVIKRFLPQETVQKISIIGSNYLSELEELINLDNIPSFYGGNCKCEDHEGGCEAVDIGPWNDGTAKGYPIAEWEDMEKQDIATALPMASSQETLPEESG